LSLKLAKLNGQAEIFHSIQGEGISIGKPSIFVRTSLCNLHCIWCDTDYTWNWVGTRFPHHNDAQKGYAKFDKNDWIIECSIEEVAERVMAFPCKNVILTGGEPMLHQTDLIELMRFLKKKDAGYTFEVETNGTLIPSIDFDALVNQYNVSPKLANSGNPQKLREKPKAYRAFSQNEKAYFKFVLAEKSDLEEVLRLCSDYDLPTERVLLMPEASNRRHLSARRKWLVEVCKKEGFRYSDRLHVGIWGTKNGV